MRDETQLGWEIESLEAELAALRPWAEMGKGALAWWYNSGFTNCPMCHRAWEFIGHDSDCFVPALLAQLEADPDAKR